MSILISSAKYKFDAVWFGRVSNALPNSFYAPPSPNVDSQQKHRYWRMNVTATQSGANPRVGVGYVEFHDTLGGAQIAAGGTPITSASEPGYTAANAFQTSTNGTAPGWVSDGSTPGRAWVGYAFPTPVNIQEIAYTRANGGTGYDENGIAPRDLTLDYSDDGVQWFTVATYTNLPTPYVNVTSGATLAAAATYAPPQQIVGTAANFGLSKTGARAALALRKLYADYTGPLVQVQSSYGAVDVYPGPDGRIDRPFLNALGPRLTVLKWYDQSGFNHHAVPTVSGASPDLVAAGNLITLPNGSAGIRVHETPLDIANFGFLQGSAGGFMSAALSMTSLYSWPVVASNLMSDNSSFSFGFADGSTRWEIQRNGSADAAPGFSGAPAAIYSGTAYQDDANVAHATLRINGATAAPVTLSYGGNAQAKTRIGQSWQNPTAIGGDRMIDGTLGEILFYDPTVIDADDIIGNQRSFFGL